MYLEINWKLCNIDVTRDLAKLSSIATSILWKYTAYFKIPFEAELMMVSRENPYLLRRDNAILYMRIR